MALTVLAEIGTGQHPVRHSCKHSNGLESALPWLSALYSLFAVLRSKLLQKEPLPFTESLLHCLFLAFILVNCHDILQLMNIIMLEQTFLFLTAIASLVAFCRCCVVLAIGSTQSDSGHNYRPYYTLSLAL